jgi:hypothetical protein
MSLNAYDQYEHLENRLTHALAVTLERCPGLKKFLFKEAGCIGRIGLTKKCRVVLQLAAGQIKEKQNEEECGIPDLTISDDKGNAIIVESKVGSGLRWQQLASHENRARRNELRVAFGLAITGRDTDSLLLQKWLSERRLKCPWKHITWRQIYRLACKFDSNPWIRELRDYMQLVAEQLDQNHMEVGVKIVDFRGVPFMGFQDYEVGQAKRVLKALMDELREDRQFLHDLGFTKNQMPQTHKAIKNSLKGVRILNLSGFINLYAFCEQRDFVFWPDELPLGPNSLLTIESNVVVSLRKRLREALDYHAGLYPGLKAWLPLHRQHANAFFKQLRAQPIYLSVEHLDSRMLLGCVEGRNTFWVWYDRDAIKSEKNIVAGQMWNMVLNLIFKMISEFDDLLSTEKQSVVFEIQFPGLNDLEKGFLKNIPVLAGPDVTAVDNRIIISCSNEYIRNFGLSDNVGDRLMVEALMNGISKITGNILSGERSAPILDKLASDRYARSFHILPADSGKDRILATVPFSSPRFVQLEDYSWIQVGMRELLEINLPSNQVISEGALEICDKMVELLWRKIKKSLIGLDRKSLLLKCLQKHDAIEADRARWSITITSIGKSLKPCCAALPIRFEKTCPMRALSHSPSSSPETSRLMVRPG